MWLSKDDKSTLIGKDLDDLSIDTNPDTEQIKNILGESNFSHNGYTPSIAVEYVARTEDAIYPILQKIANTLSVNDEDITMDLIVATLTEEVKESDTKTLTGEGFKVPARIVVDNDGGSTAGYAISFTAYESGNRIQGSVSVSNREVTFTAGGTAGASVMSTRSSTKNSGDSSLS
ncbi:MAG: hypothetical protein NC415_13605 [bacterium]|nr:hypothetical protein [bacterium]